jgi:serine/threonine-protein kinase
MSRRDPKSIVSELNKFLKIKLWRIMNSIDQIEHDIKNKVLIATGGQKSVYSANHTIYGKVAFKEVKDLDEEMKKRMEREVSILRELNTSSYPKIFDMAFSDDKKRCIILEEFIESDTLRKVMNNYFEPRKALELIREIVIKLSTIWEKNIVHRDIKPENILIENSGSVKIIDLGCARDLDEKTITQMGGAPHTKAYAAPEQIQYNKTRITTRTDQFPIGIILGELVYQGIHPFHYKLTKDPNLINAMLSNNWYRQGVRNYPKLSYLMERLLSVQPYNRFASTNQLLNAIDEAKGEFV